MKAILPAVEAAGFMTFIFLVIYAPNIRAWLDRQVECRHLERQLAAEDTAMHIVSDVCGPNTPCSFEDNYLCIWHRTPPHVYTRWDHCDRCYHTFETFSHEPAYGPEPVVGRCEWSEEMERRLAQ